MPISRIRLRYLTAAFAGVAACAVLARPLPAQYFGRNKVQYDRFDWRILPTEHFQIHFYPATAQATGDAARLAERWYARHKALLRHEFTANPHGMDFDMGEMRCRAILAEDG